MKLVLKKTARRARVRNGHPWVFINELANEPDPAWDGMGLPLEDAHGNHLGMGIVNSRSQIAWRRYSTCTEKWDTAFWTKALDLALQNRDEEPYRRLVWSEADNLPGLVVDQFDKILVIQALTLGADRALDQLVPILRERVEAADVLIRNDAPTRRLEGLDLYSRTQSGGPVTPFWGNIYNVDYWLDLEQSQKTGFYLDQRQEHFKVATMADGWRVLDAFCNQGAFALNCALAGAREVIGIDSSEEAIRLARKNADQNQVEVDFQAANVFDYFTHNRNERFDLIILDPPSFAPNKKALPGARKGYKELQLRSFKALNPGGILATYCCSHHVSRELFRDIIAEAAANAHRKVQVLYECGQPIDHPVLLNFPESEYLKGFILRMQD